jgi:hypothetical protein
VFGNAVTPSANRGPIRAASLPLPSTRLPSTELIHGAVASIDTSAVVSIGIASYCLVIYYFCISCCILVGTTSSSMTGWCKGSGCCVLSIMNQWIDDSRSKVWIRNRCMIVLVAAAAAAAAAVVVVVRRMLLCKQVRRMEPTCT